ncbi:MAG TPA: hypothetical protein VLZ83_10960 [Edaphocola sp.]|nr:hypothetical protein [Edaphocola sp.]
MGCLKLEILEQTFVPMQIRYKSALGIDPLADGGGQQILSPYHAMGCNPAMMIDPLGLQSGGSNNNVSSPYLDLHTITPVYIPLMGSYTWDVMNYNRNIRMSSPGETAMQEYFSKLIASAFITGIIEGAGMILGGLVSRGDGGEQQKSESDIISYRLPGLSDEDLDKIAKQAGRQPIGDENCNVYSLRFVSLILKVSNIDWKKVIKENETAKHSPKYTSELLNAINLNFKSMKAMFPNGVGEAISNGGLAYVIEHNSYSNDGSFHRVVLVSVDYNLNDPYKSSARVYDPAEGAIVDRPNFFKKIVIPGTVSFTYYPYSYILFKH